MIVIGIGSNSRATPDDIAAAVRALEALLRRTCAAVATLDRPDQLSAIRTACKMRALPLHALPGEALLARSVDCATQSAASLAAHGIPSVAEAAALAAAGPGSRLLIARQTYPNVTAAASVSAPPHENHP